jgi:hypothetical protein
VTDQSSQHSAEAHVQDEDVKNKMISELTMENRRLKEELAQKHFAKFRIEQDLTSKL